MKSILLFLSFVISSVYVCGQDLVMSIQAESTVAGFQYGGTVTYETKKMWALGGFYQQSGAPSNEHHITNTFYGTYLQVPLAKGERLAFFGVLRGGFVNNKFLVLVPGFETRINIGKRFGIGVGTGFRMNYPSFSSRLLCKIL